MNYKRKLIGMFFVGFGLTFIEMITLYWSMNKHPAIIFILFFFAFSMFNGFVYMEAINNGEPK